MHHRIDVEVTTPLHATEVRDRVAAAITNLFPGAEVAERHGELVGTTHTMAHFGERLAEQNIVDAARDELRRGVEGDTIAFDLKKQAAHEGVVNFAVGNPDELGDLHVRVRVDAPDPEAFIDYLTPGSAGRDDGA